ncbi:MAG TPA: 3-isopropylmalate dehydrogenase [Acidimicrobiia bacterium]|jgi:3-isopropylmalate dehydrogenase|nr:3-isopropylmalate dehydrogenase [Acidimicrobiia bacterium]
MSSHRIAVVPGDGTGPEVITEALKVLEVASAGYGFDLDLTTYDLGGERYLRTGETLPGEVLDRLRESDAILFGAVGHPEVPPGILEQDILLRLRRELDQYINLRPVKLHPGVHSPIANVAPEEVDFVVVRENSEGLYVGKGSFTAKDSPFEVAVQESVNTWHGVERCVRYAFELAMTRPRRHLTMCGKTNVLKYSWDLWQRVFDQVAEEFPDVETAYAHVDATCLWMVEDPGRFDVIVTDNMFGDIITDLAAAIQGGLGIAAGGNVSPNGVSMFEPIGGTAPGFERTGKINPLAAIGAAAMMLQELGETEAANAIETAVATVAGSLPSLRAGEMGATTTEVGDRVAALVKETAKVQA